MGERRRFVRSVDLDAQDANGSSAHSLAVAAGHLDASAAPSSKVICRQDAFFEAARQGDADACARFCREGIDLEAEVGGETALLLAANSASSKVVKALLSARADPNHADAFLCETPLLRAVLSKSSSELLWMLLEAKADPSKQDLTGRTA